MMIWMKIRPICTTKSFKTLIVRSAMIKEFKKRDIEGDI